MLGALKVKTDAECDIRNKLPTNVHMMVLVNIDQDKTLIIGEYSQFGYDGVISKPSYAKKAGEAGRDLLEVIREITTV